MPNIPLQSLERGNFLPGSDENESTRRVHVGNDTDNPIPVIKDSNQQSIEQNNILSALGEITNELKKINFYFEYLTKVKPTDSDISETLV